MNLSNHLQMPSAPQAPATTSNGSTTGTGAVVGLDNSGKIKFDFAQIMARQFEQMPALKRQNLAALKTAAKQADASGETETGTSAAEPAPDARPRGIQSNTQARDRALPDTADRTRGHDDAAQASDETEDDTTAHDKRRASARADEPGQTTDGLLQAWMNTMGLPPATGAAPTPAIAETATTAITAPQAGATTPTLADGTALSTVALSPQMNIITDPRHTPSASSLSEFARAMGMDPQAVRQLIGDAGAAATTDGLPIASATSPSGGASPLSAQLGASLPAPPSMSPDAANALNSLTAQIATHIQAQSSGTPSQAVQLPAAATAPATVLPQASAPTDANALANTAAALQVGALPVAPLQATTTQNTFTDTVSLSSLELPEHDIAALASSFAQGGEADLSQQGDANNASDGDAPSGGFAQTLAARSAAAEGNTATRNTQASGRSLTEIHDKLSEKLSDEMAQRMNEQIGRGEWKMKFGLRPAHLGGVEIQLEMKDGKLNAQLNADNPLTRDLLQNGSQRLRESLANLGIQADQVSVGQNGTSGQQSTAHGGHAGHRSPSGDNLAPSASLNEAPVAASKATGTQGSDTLLDLYA